MTLETVLDWVSQPATMFTKECKKHAANKPAAQPPVMPSCFRFTTERPIASFGVGLPRGR